MNKKIVSTIPGICLLVILITCCLAISSAYAIMNEDNSVTGSGTTGAPSEQSQRGTQAPDTGQQIQIKQQTQITEGNTTPTTTPTAVEGGGAADSTTQSTTAANTTQTPAPIAVEEGAAANITETTGPAGIAGIPQDLIFYMGLLLAAVLITGFAILIYRIEHAIKARAILDSAVPAAAISAQAVSTSSPIEILPEYEQEIMAPILQDPGLTQGEVVSISKYSKAKVSQVLAELEKRGLIYREKQGKTFRIYPGKRIDKQQSEQK